MTTNNAINIATGATGTVLQGQGVGTAPAFTATPAVTSITLSSGTALANYVEGTFTPTATGGTTAGVTTYLIQRGYYTRIGNIVNVNGLVVYTAATGTGDYVIGTLPIAISSATQYNAAGTCILNGLTFPVGTTSVAVQGAPGGTVLRIAASGSGINSANVQIANAAIYCYFNVTYQV